MKIWVWILLSIVIHLLALMLYAMNLSFKYRLPINPEYIQIEDFQIQRPVVIETLKIIEDGDIEAVDEIIDEEITNIDKIIEESSQPAYQGPTNYLPFYLAEVLPIAITPIDPPYPEEARRLGIEGRVMMEIYIDEKGRVWEVVILQSPHNSLSDIVRKSVMETKFKPAIINGQPRPVVMQLSIRFKLE